MHDRQLAGIFGVATDCVGSVIRIRFESVWSERAGKHRQLNRNWAGFRVTLGYLVRIGLVQQVAVEGFGIEGRLGNSDRQRKLACFCSALVKATKVTLRERVALCSFPSQCGSSVPLFACIAECNHIAEPVLRPRQSLHNR